MRLALEAMGVTLAQGTARELMRAIERDTPRWRDWLRLCGLLPASAEDTRMGMSNS
jgi:hypothetical protein